MAYSCIPYGACIFTLRRPLAHLAAPIPLQYDPLSRDTKQPREAYNLPQSADDPERKDRMWSFSFSLASLAWENGANVLMSTHQPSVNAIAPP